MRNPLTILLVFLAICCHAQSDTLNRVDSLGKRQGYWIIYGSMQRNKSYTDTAKVEEGNYRNNQKTGSWIMYYPSGMKEMELTYVNNRPNGHCVTYFEDGHKQEEGTWQGTRWVGDYLRYNDSGRVIQHFDYNANGIRKGDKIYPPDNGKVMIEVPLRNGDSLRKDSAKTSSHPSSGRNIENGVVTLYRNGQITMRGTFKDYKLIDGEERIYDANGILIQRKMYRNGVYVGDLPLEE